MWDLIMRAKRASSMLPVLETVLAAFGACRPVRARHQGQPEQPEQREQQRRPVAAEPESRSERSDTVLVDHSSAVSSLT
jgi:hypothetical protein